MEHYLAWMWNLCSDTLLQQEWLSHHGDASGRRLRSSWSISTNKERLTNIFPFYHSGYQNLFRKFVSFAVQAFMLHIFLETIEINSIVLEISWQLMGKVLLILKLEMFSREDGKTLKKLSSIFSPFSYGMMNQFEVFENVCSNEDSFSWPSDELMIGWLISEVRLAWWNFGYQVHLLAYKQDPQKSTRFLLLLRKRVSRFFYNALSTQSPWLFLLSYKLPCENIQNSDAPFRFCMRSNLFH